MPILKDGETEAQEFPQLERQCLGLPSSSDPKVKALSCLPHGGHIRSLVCNQAPAVSAPPNAL